GGTTDIVGLKDGEELAADEGGFVNGGIRSK
ncbi:hypothetical protein A2U01_0102042, partial [Trifolium medium]|nr:hypothetical protein [Trifolium medium]